MRLWPKLKINRVLGIDPGLDRTGWAVIENGPAGILLTAAGLIHTDKNLSFPERLKQTYENIQEVINKFQPTVAALEVMFFLKRAMTMSHTIQTRGVIVLALAQNNLEIYEYPAKRVKLTISGNGAADKKQMQRMVQLTLKLKEILKPDDVADAAAIALCHLKSAPLANQIKLKQNFLARLEMEKQKQIKKNR